VAFVDNVRPEISEIDSRSEARLLIAQVRGALGAGGPTPAIKAQIERAAELARASGDVRTELRARQAVAVMRSESGLDDPTEWRLLAEDAVRAGDWAMAVAAMRSYAMSLMDDEAVRSFEPLERTREAAAAHGLTEDVGWTDYLEAEAAFVTGDWERALAAGTRAMDLGEQNAYRRLVVRTIHVLVPIAAVRGNRQVLERAARWYESLALAKFPDSPYARIVRPAQDLELAAYGLAAPYVPEVDARLVSFEGEPGMPSFAAAIDRVFRAWLEAGEVDGSERALAVMTAAVPGFTNPTALALGTYQLMRGRLAHAREELPAARSAALEALRLFRVSDAPWWIAKAIRLLERADAADEKLVAEVERIERHLGAIAPTA
jgi:hypothetical protein